MSRFFGSLARLDASSYRLGPEIESRLLTPCLVIYAEKVRSNIRRVIEACGGDATRWRPHIKTTKCAWVIQELLNAGVREFKCATAKEAEVLAHVAERDGLEATILVAMAHRGANLERVKRVARAHPRTEFSIIAETAEGAREAAPLGVFVDVNVGMDRSGCSYEEAVKVAEAAGDAFRGIHVYEGHAMRLGKTRAEREPRLFEIYDKVLELDAQLSGSRKLAIITAGTPAFLCSLAHTGLTATGRHTVAPGTVVFSDVTCEAQVPELELEPAAIVLSRVFSKPANERCTLDAGHKSLSADAGVPTCYVIGEPNLEPLKPSEEHLPAHCAASSHIGDTHYLVPAHICPTVNLAEEAILVGDPGSASYHQPLELPKSGGPMISVLKIEARAHDLLLDSRLLYHQ